MRLPSNRLIDRWTDAFCPWGSLDHNASDIDLSGSDSDDERARQKKPVKPQKRERSKSLTPPPEIDKMLLRNMESRIRWVSTVC